MQVHKVEQNSLNRPVLNLSKVEKIGMVKARTNMDKSTQSA